LEVPERSFPYSTSVKAELVIEKDVTTYNLEIPEKTPLLFPIKNLKAFRIKIIKQRRNRLEGL
jgi:hypothetical protein